MLAEFIVEALLDHKKWKTPDLPEPVEPKAYDSTVHDTEDLAAEYLEGEVGRHDWEHNWPQHKSIGDSALRDKVSAWLRHYEVDHDPDAIISYLNDLHKMKSGQRWK